MKPYEQNDARGHTDTGTFESSLARAAGKRCRTQLNGLECEDQDPTQNDRDEVRDWVFAIASISAAYIVGAVLLGPHFKWPPSTAGGLLFGLLITVWFLAVTVTVKKLVDKGRWRLPDHMRYPKAPQLRRPKK